MMEHPEDIDEDFYGEDDLCPVCGAPSCLLDDDEHELDGD